MQELLPVAAGLIVGIAAQRVDSDRFRTAFVIFLSLVFGALATIVSGEWIISWLFIGVDTLIVFSAAVAVTVLFYGRTHWLANSTDR